MSTITNLASNTNGADSMVIINDNFDNLNADKVETLSDLSITASATELNYVDGVTSAIQTQLDSKAPLSSPTLITPDIGVATATSINGNTITAGSGTLTLQTFTLTVAANAQVSGTNSGDQDLSGYLTKSGNLSGITSASAARSNLGLGTLATQNGTFSGTSSGTNTGDQDLSGYSLTTHNHDGVYAPVLTSDENYVTDAQLVVISNTSGTNTGDNATNTQYSGLAASKQDVLISGTNIKTINTVSLLGSGDITVTASPAGSDTQVQFNNVGVTGASANLTWVSPALTIGATGATGQLKLAGATSGTVTIQPADTAGTWTLTLPDNDGISDYVLRTDGSGVTTWIRRDTFNDIFIGNGGAISFSGGDITLTHSANLLTMAGGNLSLGANSLIVHSILADSTDGVLLESANGTDVAIFGPANTANALFYGAASFTGAVLPVSDNTPALGASGQAWSDLFLGNGAVVNFNAGNYTITHSAGLLTFSGAATIGSTLTFPTPFTLGATSVTTTGTQLNYLNAATGTTGTTSTNLVFSASPTFTGTVGAAAITMTGNLLVDSPTFSVDAANNRVGVGVSSPSTVFVVLSGQLSSGTITDYAMIRSSSGTAYQGGLMLSNSIGVTGVERPFKMTATFSGTTAAKAGFGFVASNVTETWIGSNPLIEFFNNTDAPYSIFPQGVRIANGQALRTHTTTAHTFNLEAYDVDGAAYTAFATLTSGNTPTMTLSNVTSSTNFNPTANDGGALGTTSLGWSDVHIATGGVINWNNGAITATESSESLNVQAKANITIGIDSDSTTTNATLTIQKDAATSILTLNENGQLTLTVGSNTNGITVSGAIAGGDVRHRIFNTDVTAGSQAELYVGVTSSDCIKTVYETDTKRSLIQNTGTAGSMDFRSNGSMKFGIDGDNDSTTEIFAIYNNGLSTIRWQMAEDGTVTMGTTANTGTSTLYSGNIQIGYTTDTADKSLVITSDAKSFISLVADSTNTNEDDTAYIKYSQDGAGVIAWAGCTGTANQLPDGTAYTGITANAFVIGHSGGSNNGVATIVRIGSTSSIAWQVTGTTGAHVFNSIATTAAGYTFNHTNTTADAFTITGSTSTTGGTLKVYDNSADTSTRSVVTIHQDHASATGATCLTLRNDSTGNALDVTGGIQLQENSSIKLDPAGSADGKYTGTTVAATAGYTQAFGDLVYLDPTDSRWEQCDANSASGADGDSRGIIGIVVSAGTDGTACTILLNGIIRADAKFPTFTINNPIYVSETAGSVTQTKPTTTDAVVRTVGFAITADEMYFNPSSDYVTAV